MPWDRLPGAGADDVTISSNTDVTDARAVHRHQRPGLRISGRSRPDDQRRRDVDDNRWCLWIRATGAVTINGTINGNGNGAVRRVWR